MDFPDLFLSDGFSQIDFVIVYSNKVVVKRRYFKRIFENFLAQLDEIKVDYEVSSSVENEDLCYLKIHVPSLILEEYAKIHNIELTYRSKSPKMKEYLYWCRCLHTVLSLPDQKHEVFSRYRPMNSIMEYPLTQAERILITAILLSHVRFGKGVDEQGVKRIMNIGVFKAAFPLHEGKPEWTSSGPLTDRQLLCHYWVGIKNIAKIQPLAAIEKYFGPEMAFLYAYLQLTTEMQIVASILGLSLYIIGISVESKTSVSISDKLMCPSCDPKYCRFRLLNTHCDFLFRLNQTFDNIEMFILGVLITLWGTIFLEIWKKRQTLYRLKWNLNSLDNDLEIRTGYEKKANLLVSSPFTHELEPAMSTPDIALRVFTSTASVVLLGKFYTHPGDEVRHDIVGVYIADACHLGECNSDLAVQVMFILGIKHLLFKCLGRYFFRMSIVLWKKYKRKKSLSNITLPQWENDYILKSFGRYDIMKKYIEIILRHGLVLFFTSVCPFTPILTTIVNVLEMKLYSHAYIHFYRRPIPRKVEGIEMFYFILQALTWFGVTVNAIIALMTKDFAKMHFYMSQVKNNITAYMNKRFSAFSMDDFESIEDKTFLDKYNSSVCYFPGNRFPPEHPKKYKEHVDLHEYQSFGWMLILIYLHAVFMVTGLIARLMPDSSSDVKDYVNSIVDENRKDIRKFRNQQYTSRKSISKSVLKLAEMKGKETPTDSHKPDE